uniref:Uncharacterized protein n=1 Tax=Sphaeramia orbicularis TaxID=375764 RepID=A0A672YC80_9TELE
PGCRGYLSSKLNQLKGWDGFSFGLVLLFIKPALLLLHSRAVSSRPSCGWTFPSQTRHLQERGSEEDFCWCSTLFP